MQAEPSRLFSKINQVPNHSLNYSSLVSSSLPNPLHGTTTHSSPFHNDINNANNHSIQGENIVEAKTTSVDAPVSLILRILPSASGMNGGDINDENLVTLHQSSKGLTLRAPKDGIVPPSTRKFYPSPNAHQSKGAVVHHGERHNVQNQGHFILTQ